MKSEKNSQNLTMAVPIQTQASFAMSATIKKNKGINTFKANNQDSNEFAEFESQNETDKNKSMKELLAKSRFQLPKSGEYLNGKIINNSRGNVLIDLGALGTGVVYPGEFYDNPEMQKTLKPNDAVTVVVIELENEDGYRELSLKAAQRSSAWVNIRKLFDSGEVVKTKIINLNKGGLVVEIQGVQGFIPLSQLNEEHYPRIEGGDTTKIIQALQKYRNQEFELKIIDIDEMQNKLILSEKAVASKPNQGTLSKFSLDEVLDCTVTQITDYGVFVNIEGNIDGLIHTSDLTWSFIDDPGKVVSVGQKIKAKIISLENQQILLSLKALETDPWLNANSYGIGMKIKGKIIKIDVHGVKVEVAPGIIGTVPSSEITNDSNKAKFKPGEEHDFAIIEFDQSNHLMILTPERSSQKKYN